MNAILLDKIQKTADEFAKIAKRVNVSSRLRTNHSREALLSITYLRSIGASLIDDLEYVAEKNIEQRDSDIDVKTSYENLRKEISALFKLLKESADKKSLKAAILRKIKTLYDDFKESTAGALTKLELILGRDEEIIEKDKEILALKGEQQKLLEKLQEDAQKSCNDAVKAVKGSQSNLDRGLKMVDNFNHLESSIENKNVNDLNKLLNDIQRGWMIADNVNISSMSQLEFAEKVYENTTKLHDESGKIEDLVIERHKFYAESLYIFADLTELLTSKFKKYSDFELLVEDLNLTSDTSSVAVNFVSQIKKITDIVNYILRKNHERINSSHYYADNEASTVDLTKEEARHFSKILEEIEFMTETTRYPIEGSNKNITNGQVLEQLLINALEEDDIPIEKS
ncbi:MAG: hypothetical protein GY754_39380, partial [bacterium]|nr:hypothetical protein [bacterium]